MPPIGGRVSAAIVFTRKPGNDVHEGKAQTPRKRRGGCASRVGKSLRSSMPSPKYPCRSVESNKHRKSSHFQSPQHLHHGTHESTINPAEFRHSTIHTAVNPPLTKTIRKSLSRDSTPKRRRFAKTPGYDSWAVPLRDQSLHRMHLSGKDVPRPLAATPLWR
jgi:hypothetical protein